MSGHFFRHLLPLVAASLVLTACGGGGGDSGGHVTATTVMANAQTAADGLSVFNARRQLLGLQPLVRDPALTQAAQLHSEYQAANGVITHEQTAGERGFTGVTVADRMQAAGYTFPQSSYAFGEVISRTSDPSGVRAAEDLIAAIYHRFVIFEPVFTKIGVGAAAVPGGPTYFTTDFFADSLDEGLGFAGFVTYPVNGQQNVPQVFFSDNEVPDPVPGRNAVGYPISVHADIEHDVTEVTEFTVRPQGGSALAVQLLTNANDGHTPIGAAAIVPLEVLAPNTVYEVRFEGKVDGVIVNRTWTFTTG